MKIDCSLKRWHLLVLLMSVQPMVYADVDAGYEAAKGSGQCPANAGVDGPWGFSLCNCTSYVAYRLRLNNVKRDNELFDNTWGNNKIYFGNATNWNNGAILADIREDQYPAVGAVAHWERTTEKTSDDNVTDFGHVAYVQRVYTSEGTGRIVKIDVVEYNWIPPHLYSSRTLSAGSEKYPTSFLHFEEKGRDANATNATCVAGLSVKPYEDTSEGTFCWVHDGSDVDCNDADEYYYFDYQHCRRYDVSREGSYTPNQYCSHVGSNRGYIAHIDDWFPEPIDPNHWGEGFAGCDRNGSGGYGGSSNVGNNAWVVPLL